MSLKSQQWWNMVYDKKGLAGVLISSSKYLRYINILIKEEKKSFFLRIKNLYSIRAFLRLDVKCVKYFVWASNPKKTCHNNSHWLVNYEIFQILSGRWHLNISRETELASKENVLLSIVKQYLHYKVCLVVDNMFEGWCHGFWQSIS